MTKDETIDFQYIENNIFGLDTKAMKKARERQHHLIKPIGSLGKLEDISVKFAGITGSVHNVVDKKVLFLFGADNGICEEGVSGSPQELTNFLMSCYGADKGSGINVICKHNRVDLKLVDMGIIGQLDYTNIDNKKLMNGSHNFLKGLAIPRETAEEAVNIGFSYAKYAHESGYHIIGTGEVGMGNTTTAAACIMAVLGIDDSDIAIGKGGGLTDEMFSHKKEVILKALCLHKPNKKDTLDILSKVGGLDIAALTGLFLGAAYFRIPIVVDGVISIAAALLAVNINENCKNFLFPSHLSEEPGYKIAAEELELKPFLNLNMRLGEGSGCPIAMHIIENALVVMNDMTTFQDLEIDGSYRV